ncbi:MAG TPA: PIG-L family deacetylase [Candidatus Paceibacterota bacterium]|nr:PIG-L family deacetylase [Candidatus Paceibacterota bacterium]
MLDLTRKRLLVVAPHPDDEIFGCGGLIQRVKAEGGKVYVLYLTVGATKDFSKKGSSGPDERIREIRRVVKRMRIDGFHIAFPGDEYMLQLDHMPQRTLINEIERGRLSLETLKPQVLAFPSFADYNQDHRAANEACIAATRPVNGSFKHTPRMLLEYELPYTGWSPTSGREPNFFLPLDDAALSAKREALKLYASQMKTKKGPISVYASEQLAKMRGVLSGVDAAEAYVLRRLLV